METKAVWLYGKDDLQLESFALPAIKKDEVLVEIVSDSRGGAHGLGRD